jgi:putative ABC transport system permease protein
LERERANAQAQIDSGWTAYNQGMADYNAGVETLNREEAEARRQLTEAKGELETAQADLDSVPDPEWFCFTRQEGASFESYYQDTLRLQKVGYVFPMVFFLVAVLVSLTTVSRMVEEQRTQIGIYKALGYRPAAIIMKYALYALISGLLGSSTGVLLGSWLFPHVIMDAYSHLYSVPAPETPIPWGIAAFAITVSVGAVLAVTLITCAGAMQGEPALLMRPKSPKTGKQLLLEKIPFIWNALGFISKVTARNIFRYKRRFFMTLAGIAGCAALLLTAFGLRGSIGSVAPLQYGEGGIIAYDAKVYLKDITRPEQRTALAALLPESRRYIREESVKVNAGALGRGANAAGEGNTVDPGNGAKSAPEMTVSLVVPEGASTLLVPVDSGLSAASLEGFVQLLSPETGGTVPIPAQGVLLTEKAARALQVSPGDPITLTGVDNKDAVRTTVSGIVENYIFHYMYMAPEQYAQLFGQELHPNGLFLRGEFDREALLKEENVRAVALTTDLLAIIADSTDALGVVTIVLLVLACALAFVVLFTLTVININERTRELATIKVLGFQDTETAFYTYRENVAVTCIGIGLGLVGGIFLNTFVLSSIEVDILKFPHDIYPMSFLLAAALSLVFALLVNAMMYRKLVAIDMVESLKSVD